VECCGGLWVIGDAARPIVMFLDAIKKNTYQTFISLCPAKPLYPPYQGILYTRCDGLSIEKIKKNKEKESKDNEMF
jgi:hypothetical protein